MYTTGLCLYFCTALCTNFLISISFTEVRCHFHNIGWINGKRAASLASEWSKILFMTGNFWGSFYRNLVMDLLLLFKASMIQEAGLPRCTRLLRLAILAQMV